MANGSPDVIVKRVTPTITANSYTTGMQVGTLQTLSAIAPDDMGGLVLTSVAILDKAKQSAAIDIVFYLSAPTVTSADRATANITDANQVGKIGSIVQVTTYCDFSGNSVGFANGLAAGLAPASGTTIYAYPIIRASATYGSTSDLEFIYTFLRGPGL